MDTDGRFPDLPPADLVAAVRTQAWQLLPLITWRGLHRAAREDPAVWTFDQQGSS